MKILWYYNYIFQIALILLVSGCVAHPLRLGQTYPPLEAQEDPLKQFLDSRISIMTYDDAISRWGGPSEIVEGDKIFVAVFCGKRCACELKLSFSKESKLLMNYNYLSCIGHAPDGLW